MTARDRVKGYLDARDKYPALRGPLMHRIIGQGESIDLMVDDVRALVDAATYSPLGKGALELILKALHDTGSLNGYTDEEKRAVALTITGLLANV